jgi:DNA-binding IscR family transcriptional regulator
MAQHYNNGEVITLISISEKLGISKIYLEQVFALLKRGKYRHIRKRRSGRLSAFTKTRKQSVYDVLSAVETTLFENAEATVPETAPDIEAAMRVSAFDYLDKTLKAHLKKSL